MIGVGAAFVALPAYSLMQIGLFGLFGSAASGILAALGFSVPWYACAIVAWAVVAVLGLLWVDLSGKVLAVLLVAEISIVLIYDLVMVANPANGEITFSPAPLFTPVAGTLLVLAIASFVGFEATVVLSEEAKDPKRTTARATHIAVLLAGLPRLVIELPDGPPLWTMCMKSDQTTTPHPGTRKASGTAGRSG